jgi:hypothetical protein
MCKAASLPAEELGVIQVPYFGRKIKVPGNRTFAEWNVTIINDEDFLIRNVFEQWSNALNGHFNNLRDANAQLSSSGGGTGGYAVDATIIQYAKIGSVIKSYTMVGMWPSSVSAIDTSWDATDQIEEFQVVFQYNWWKSDSTV